MSSDCSNQRASRIVRRDIFFQWSRQHRRLLQLSVTTIQSLTHYTDNRSSTPDLLRRPSYTTTGSNRPPHTSRNRARRPISRQSPQSSLQASHPIWITARNRSHQTLHGDTAPLRLLSPRQHGLRRQEQRPRKTGSEEHSPEPTLDRRLRRLLRRVATVSTCGSQAADMLPQGMWIHPLNNVKSSKNSPKTAG